MIVARSLRQAGRRVEVVEAANGQEALQLAKEQRVDVVLTDWNMPVMDGLQLKEAFHDMDPSVPFIFVTTEWTPQQQAHAAASGVVKVLPKPFTPEKLDAALRESGL